MVVVPEEDAFFHAHVQVGIGAMAEVIEGVRVEGQSFLVNALVRIMNKRNGVK